MNRDLRERFATMKTEMDPATAERHLVAVAAELRDPSPIAKRRRPRARRITLVAAATLLLLPAAALAAEDAVPGDLLYPIKLVAESVLSIVDPNIEAEHRIEELEVVVDRNAPADEIADRLTDAEQSVADSDAPPELIRRLDAVRDRIRDRTPARDTGPERDPVRDDAPPRDVPPEPSPITTTVPTDTPPTDSPVRDEAPHDGTPGTTDAPDRPRDPTTTEPPRGDDRPPDDRQG